MGRQNVRQVFWIGKTTSSLGLFTPVLPKPADWDRLLAKLSLNDAQALEAIKSDEAIGQQLQDFVLRFCRQQFVPEAVIDIVFRRRKEKRSALPTVSRATTLNSDAAAATSGGQR